LPYASQTSRIASTSLHTAYCICVNVVH